jgi:PadR family transcriptional regulator, regulatory protein PadR
MTRAKLQPGGLSWNVMRAVHKLRGDAYGVTIRREIADSTGREVPFGAVYTTLARLERDGLLRSHEGDPTPERGGRAKRLYELTGRGVAALQASLQDIEQMWASISMPGALA